MVQSFCLAQVKERKVVCEYRRQQDANINLPLIENDCRKQQNCRKQPLVENNNAQVRNFWLVSVDTLQKECPPGDDLNYALLARH